MTHSVKAKIYWLSKEEGGRNSPPAGKRYSTVARFEEDGANWPNEAWSVLVGLDELPSVSLETIATIKFLSPEAPENLLQIGNQFEILEGRHVVAKGIIVKG
jgi:translation elongation factor EF-Tu-like GTPase